MSCESQPPKIVETRCKTGSNTFKFEVQIGQMSRARKGRGAFFVFFSLGWIRQGRNPKNRSNRLPLSRRCARKDNNLSPIFRTSPSCEGFQPWPLSRFQSRFTALL